MNELEQLRFENEHLKARVIKAAGDLNQIAEAHRELMLCVSSIGVTPDDRYRVIEWQQRALCVLKFMGERLAFWDLYEHPSEPLP